MEDILIRVFYESLTSITPAFIGVTIPFAGAYWIYKKNIKTSAELTIFEVGREIGTVLREETHLKSPLMGISYSYIDENLQRVDEFNRNIAIHKLLIKLVSRFPDHHKITDLNEKEKAEIIIAIATERLENLVPSDIDWSGKGISYSVGGVKITLDDRSFPFGTKLYRKWIDDFSLIYNDLWICSHPLNRKRITEEFSKSDISHNRIDINSWLINIEKMIHKIRVLHSILISQIQIIDNTIDEKQSIKNILFCGFYLFLLGIVGYYSPRILFELKMLTSTNLILLSVGALASSTLAVFRLIPYSSGHSETLEKRKLSIPGFLDHLKEMKGESLLYKYSYVEDIISMHKDLSLPKSIVKQLRKCAKEIVHYNGLAKEFSSEMDEFINKLKASYDTKHENLGGCPLKLHKIPDEGYDMDDIFKAILNKDVNLTIEYNEQHLSTSLHTINLKELDSVRKYELCEDLRKLRSKTRNLTSFKYLDKSQKNLNSIIELLERKLGNLS